MDLNEIRGKLDTIDDSLTELFVRRMSLVGDVAEYKIKNSIPILNQGREDAIIERITAGLDADTAQYVRMLYTNIFELSRASQAVRIAEASQASDAPCFVFSEDEFPTYTKETVACQGASGANSESAAHALFSSPNVRFYSTFEQVIRAVESGESRFGLLPIENSLHGPVTAVYDLLKSSSVGIVRSIKIPIRHSLLAKNGVSVKDLKEIYSHEQALAQCAERLHTLPDVHLIPCENTAVAARLVAESDRRDIAAIASPRCAGLYGLQALENDIQSNALNFTRFICICASPIVYKGADKISLMFTVPNRPGTLFGVISRLASAGINMTKIESRPIPGTDFEFMFYVDIDGSLENQRLVDVLRTLSSALEQFKVLGGYSEVSAK